MRSRPQPTFTLDPLHRFLLISSLLASVIYTLWTTVRIPSMPEQLMVWTVFSLALIYIIVLGGIAGDWPISPAIWIGMAVMLGSMAFFILLMSRL